MSFYGILEHKNAFLGFKNKKFKKVGKIDIFPNGLTHGFGAKISLLPTFVFTQYRPANCLLRYCRTKKKPL